jgi:hypothetical protein
MEQPIKPEHAKTRFLAEATRLQRRERVLRRLVIVWRWFPLALIGAPVFGQMLGWHWPYKLAYLLRDYIILAGVLGHVFFTHIAIEAIEEHYKERQDEALDDYVRADPTLSKPMQPRPYLTKQDE